jgi:hypothetical protein
MSLEIIEIIDEFRSNDQVYQKLNLLFKNENNLFMKNNYLIAMEFKENLFRIQALNILKNKHRQSLSFLINELIQNYYKSSIAIVISIIISNSLYKVPSALVSIVRLVIQGTTFTIISPIFISIMTIQTSVNLILSYVPFSKRLELDFNPYNISQTVASNIDIFADEILKHGGEELANSFYYITTFIIMALIYLSLICFEKLQAFRSVSLSLGYINCQFDSNNKYPNNINNDENLLRFQSQLPLLISDNSTSSILTIQNDSNCDQNTNEID